MKDKKTEETFSENENIDIQDVEKNDAVKETTKKRKASSYVIEGIIYILVALFCIFIVPKYIIQRTVVDGSSMESTLHSEESLLVDKITYRFSDPERYDIVVFAPRGNDDEDYYVKRIFGLPGETIQIVGNDILINGKKIADPYRKDDDIQDPGVAKEPYKLAEDEYFVLGDNREVSLDSRTLPSEDSDAPGPVKFENLRGRAILRIWPLKQFGTID